MLTFDQIKELVELVSGKGLDGLELERAGFRLKIDGRQAETAAVAESAAPGGRDAERPPPATPGDAPTQEVTEEAGTGEEELHSVTSPIVGTFYRSPSPDSDAFVKVGDLIEKGQVLCIVEAMKLMNEIESDVAGEIVDIRPKNAQAVEFGETLFTIRPA